MGRQRLTGIEPGQVQAVIARTRARAGGSPTDDVGARPDSVPPRGPQTAPDGIFPTIDAAVEAAWLAYQAYLAQGLDRRHAVIDAVRAQMRAHARALVDHGADVNVRAHGGITALMLAVINDPPDAVKLLLARGADVNAQSGAGWTALTFAVWKHDGNLERVLLSHGARPNVIDKQGWRPVEYAASPATPAVGSPSGVEGTGPADVVPMKWSGGR